MALYLSVEHHAQIKMTPPALQKADRAMDDHLLPASQMWKNSCRIMYQVIMLSNCYQNEEKTPQTLDISRRLGQCYVLVQSRCSCLEQPFCSSLCHVKPQTLRVLKTVFADKIVVLLTKSLILQGFSLYEQKRKPRRIASSRLVLF